MRALASTPRPLLYLHRGGGGFFDLLLAQVTRARLPLFLHPVAMEEGWEALPPCLQGLGFAGAVLEEAASVPEGVRLEAEAEKARRVDLLVPAGGGLLGQYTEGVALERLLAQRFPGARALWLGPLRFELAPFLRGLGEVHVAAPSYAEGDAFLARLPAPLRGRVALRPEEVRALVLRVDLLLLNTPRPPLDLAQPYHAALALAPGARAVAERVQLFLGPEDLWSGRVWAVLEGLGHTPLG